MIICKTSALTFFLKGIYSKQAKALLQTDPVWLAPSLHQPPAEHKCLVEIALDSSVFNVTGV